MYGEQQLDYASKLMAALCDANMRDDPETNCAVSDYYSALIQLVGLERAAVIMESNDHNANHALVAACLDCAAVSSEDEVQELIERMGHEVD